MLKPTHLITSEVVYGGAVLLLKPSFTTIVIGGLGIWWGAQLPDMDQHKELKWLGHRTLTHSLLGLGIFAIILALIDQLLAPPFNAVMPSVFGITNYVTWGLVTLWCGALLHILEDSQSKQGVLWAWPLTHFTTNKSRTGRYKKRTIWWPWLYKVGGHGEKMWFYFMIVALTAEVFAIVQAYLPTM